MTAEFAYSDVAKAAEALAVEVRRLLPPQYSASPVLITDCETTTNWEHGPAAHVVDTRIVDVAWRWGDYNGYANPLDLVVQSKLATSVVFVGHNVSFDVLHYLRDCTPEQQQHIIKMLSTGDLLLWDTQDMEYILTGHRTKMASLNELAQKYNRPVKLDVLKDYFAQGKNTDEVPAGELREYLDHDVRLTTEVALAQALRSSPAEKRKKQILLACLRRNMTTVMMHNGLPYSSVRGNNLGTVLSVQLDLLEQNLCRIEGHALMLALPDELKGAYRSPDKLRKVLYGGTYKTTETEVVGTYKNGKPKTKKVVVEKAYMATYLGALPSESTDDAALSYIRDDVAGALPYLRDYVTGVLEYRKASKLLGTYVQPLQEMAANSKTGRIHPSLNTALTATGRLSSSKPNAQNMPSEDTRIKELFREEGWTCVEGDYKQLEMVALVIRSGCAALKNDILNGVDMHYETGRTVFGYKSKADETKELRRLVKSVNFGLVYGGGAKTLAAQSGADVAVVQRIIDAFFTRYPGVKEYHRKMDAIAKGRVAGLHGVLEGVHEDGSPLWVLCLTEATTGRYYAFQSYPNKYRKGTSSFSPTELKNYFVQGLATADFVPFACHVVLHAMVADGWMELQEDGRPKAELVTTVHDSIVAFVRDEHADEFARFLKATMEMAWPMMFEFFGEPAPDINVQCEVSAGPSWGETKALDI